jgi:hypothetical protein
MAALVFLSACASLRSHEPRYEGKRLSVWVVELNTSSKEEESLAQMAARQAMWTNVVRAVGTNGLPFYSQWIGDASNPARKYGSVLAMEILGPAAEPAIPALASLLKDDQTAPAAAECLWATGSAAIPALTEAVETLTNRGRTAAIYILGEFGPTAKPVVPVLIQIIKSDSPLAWPAMQTLVEIETNPAVILPLLALHVADTNSAPGAAYALGRLGNAGVPMLLMALTNETRHMRCFAVGALDPEFQKYSMDKSSTNSSRFRRLCCVYNLKVMGAASRSYSQGEFVVAAQAAGQYTNSTDANIREAADHALNILRPLAETNVPQMKLQERDDSMPKPALP